MSEFKRDYWALLTNILWKQSLCQPKSDFKAFLPHFVQHCPKTLKLQIVRFRQILKTKI